MIGRIRPFTPLMGSYMPFAAKPMVFGIGSSIAERRNMSTAKADDRSAYDMSSSLQCIIRGMSKVGVAIIFIILIAVLAAGFFWLVNSGGQSGTINPANSSNTTSGTVPTLVLTPPTGTASGTQSASDGTVTFTVPSDFGLATNQTQVLTRSYIPPCDANFNYCLYYIGAAYQGTNFDSAGIRIQHRTDLTTQTACLTAPPTGFSNFTPTSTTVGDYSVSEFTPLGDAGAGHYSTGTLYRLEYNGECYEFETRIGQSQFANYPSGTIQQFTATDQTGLQGKIQNILDSIALPSGETIAFPQ